jgi:DNA (cytosine-5)-methyltransferase 1
VNHAFPIKVFDFFSGCGGTSRGFIDANLEIVFAIDNNRDATLTFVNNIPGVHLREDQEGKGENVEVLSPGDVLHKNIKALLVEALQPIINSCDGHALLFSGCAPCQPFSRQKTILPNNDDRVVLLDEFRRFAEYYLPEFIFIENVPGMQNVAGKNGPFDRFINFLKDANYYYEYRVVASKKYGVPQNRRRLILIASKLANIEFPPRTHGPGTKKFKYSTSREWIYDLPELKAGEIDPNDPMHRAASLSETNLSRINATPIDGNRMDWPKDLWLPCHSNGYEGHTDVYGRMKWDEPATALTTKCHSLSNGRFGHPEQPRAISIREAASLQTFPRTYMFEGGLRSMARQIGNAVPVLLAQRFGENFNKTLERYLEENKNG